MPEVVQVSKVENQERLKSYLSELFQKGRYEEMTQAIGMRSILVEPQHALSEQASLYRFVLNLLKDRIGKSKGKNYEAWYASFPRLLDDLISSKKVVADAATVTVLTTYRDSYGAFKSVEDFFSWATTDRRLTLGQIVAYIEKTAEMSK